MYGIDVSEEALHRVAGLTKVIRLDLSNSQLPFPNEYFDLVTAVEVIEHLPYGDNLVSESFRVLKRRGYFVVATPNLGSWINRILILLGYHPTGITLEPSRQYIIGLPTSIRKKSGYVGHISAYNLRGLSSLLSAYGFKVIDKVGVALKYRQSIIDLLDKVMSMRPSLASGLVVLARKK